MDVETVQGSETGIWRTWEIVTWRLSVVLVAISAPASKIFQKALGAEWGGKWSWKQTERNTVGKT